MARYQIIFSYDGTHFHGSQRQAATRTTQLEMEKALKKIGWQGKSILLAGRTDSGTHASGQVAAFDLPWKYGTDRLQAALNSHLPDDIAVKYVSMVADDFHPRFDARSRCYRYRLFCSDVREPLRERYAWRVWPPVRKLNSLAGFLKGSHDFILFGTPPKPGGNSVRNIMNAAWDQVGDEWEFIIQADAFLYRMIRRLVFVQVAVGQGRLEKGVLRRALADNQVVREEVKKEIPAGLAPAAGLTLEEVKYGNILSR